MQLVIWGIPVVPADARALVATLIADGDRDWLEAAARLDRALGDGGGLVGLTPEQRDALLGCLVDPPPGLTELRGALLRDHEHRHRQG
jgi:hypothetical protein